MDFDGAFVVKQAVEHVGRVALGRLDHAGEEGSETVGQEAIDRGTRTFAVFCIVFEAGFAVLETAPCTAAIDPYVAARRCSRR